MLNGNGLRHFNCKLMIKQVFKKPNLYLFILIFLAYLILNIFISQFYITVQYIPYYLETIKWGELLISGLLAMIIGILIAVNMTLIYISWKRRMKIKKQTFLASLGVLGGLITGVCSACIAGFFPIVFGLFGVGFSFLSLPLKGIEVQLVVLALLVFNLYIFKKT